VTGVQTCALPISQLVVHEVFVIMLAASGMLLIAL